MHDLTLNKQFDGLQEKVIWDHTMQLKKRFNITEPVAIQILGYAMQETDNASGKDLIAYIEDLIKLHKPVKDLTSNECQILLLLKVLVNKKMPFVSKTKRIGRNDPCPCGSGLKFKKCCLGKAQLADLERDDYGKET